MKKLLLVTLFILAPLASACGATPITTQAPALNPLPEATVAPAPPVATPSAPARLFLKNRSYMRGELLDVYLPQEMAGPFPTLLVLHGFDGSKQVYAPMAKYFRKRGYATVTATWSNAPNAFCALAWIYANAGTYGFDTQRIAVFGASDGGRMAALLGAADDATEFLEDCPNPLPGTGWAKGVVTYGAVFGTPEWYLTRGFFDYYMDLVQLPPDEKAQFYQTLTATPSQHWRDLRGLSARATQLLHWLPPYWVEGSEPPHLLIHGEQDQVVDRAEPEAFAARLGAAGVKARVLMLANTDHYDLGEESTYGFQETCRATEAFLTEVFK
jgi:acetyl esterase/lipase